MYACPVASPSPGGDTAEVQAMKMKLQRAKRTLDNMKKREADAMAAKAAAEEEVTMLKSRLDQVNANFSMTRSMYLKLDLDAAVYETCLLWRLELFCCSALNECMGLMFLLFVILRCLNSCILRFSIDLTPLCVRQESMQHTVILHLLVDFEIPMNCRASSQPQAHKKATQRQVAAFLNWRPR